MPDQTKRMQVFSGTSNPELAEGVVRHLGIELGNVKIRKFANGEIKGKPGEKDKIFKDRNESEQEALVLLDKLKQFGIEGRQVSDVIHPLFEAPDEARGEGGEAHSQAGQLAGDVVMFEGRGS